MKFLVSTLISLSLLSLQASAAPRLKLNDQGYFAEPA